MLQFRIAGIVPVGADCSPNGAPFGLQPSKPTINRAKVALFVR